MSESAAARLSRLLALVPWLVQHDGVTLGECAAHFGVTEGQLQEDLELLIVCGRPGYGPDQLVDIQFWDEDFEIRIDEEIHVLDPQALGHPLRLTHEEALTLLVALRLLGQVPGVEARDAIVSAAVKLEAATRSSEAARSIAVRTGVPDEVRAALDDALDRGCIVQIRYTSTTRDEVTVRDIDPRRILTVDGVAYVEAYCHLAGAVRTFRVDRIIDAQLRESDGAGETGEEGLPAAPAAAPLLAVLDLAPGARWIVDVHGATPMAAQQGGDLRVELPLLTVDWGVRLVMSLHGEAVAVGPPALVAAVAGATEQALAAYSGQVG